MNQSHSHTMGAEAKAWTEALPLGNGRLGAMVFGGVTQERLALNEDTLWSGYKGCWRKDPRYEGLTEPDPARWQEAAELSLAGKNKEAEAILQEYFTGAYTQAYMPLGDLLLDIEHRGAEVSDAHGVTGVTDYERSLDYETATVRTSYRVGSYSYTREAFVSAVDQVMVLRLRTDHPEGVDLTAKLESQLREVAPAPFDQAAAELGAPQMIYQYVQAPTSAMPSYLGDIENPIMYAEDPAEGGMAAASAVKVLQGRPVVSGGGVMRFLRHAEIVLMVSAGTSFNGADAHPWKEGRPVLEPLFGTLEDASSYSFDELYERHVADYQELYQRVRWKAVASEGSLDQGSGGDDGELLEIQRLFNFSRYLVIAGSRPGTQATTLQGIWNAELRPPWSSNYTVNINTEMNYWPTEILALPECHEPLLTKIKGLAEAGRETARTYYGAGGTVLHHNTDIWNHTAPVGALRTSTVAYAVWPVGLGWLSRHLMDHYEYNPDHDYLVNDVLPSLGEVGRFFVEMLKEDDEGNLLFAPSTSPEHWYVTEDGTTTPVAAAATMTQSVVYEVFKHYEAACAAAVAGGYRLSEDEQGLRRRFANAFPSVNPWTPRSDHALREWSGDYPDGDPQHRHVSHLYSLYPGEDIRLDSTPELVEATRKTLEIRGGEGAGWSLGWKTLFYARLNDPDRCLSLLRRQLRPTFSDSSVFGERGGSYPNLFSAHPPFQIDGNYAVGAGIGEMFLRSRVDGSASVAELAVIVDLMPAVPVEFGQGTISGLRAKGNLELRIAYDRGRLQSVEVKNRSPEQARHVVLRYQDKEYEAHVGAGQGFGMSESSLP